MNVVDKCRDLMRAGSTTPLYSELQSHLEILLDFIDSKGLKKDEKKELVEAVENGYYDIEIRSGRMTVENAVEKYVQEIEEVLPRVENQKLIGSKGNQVFIRDSLYDLVAMLRAREAEFHKEREIDRIQRENSRLREQLEKQVEKTKNLEDDNSRILKNSAEIESEKNKIACEIDILVERVSELRKENRALRNSKSNMISHKRTVVK